MPLPEGVFGWGELLDAGVALATLALAGVTAWMATETRRVAKAAALESQAVQDEARATLELVALTRVQLQSAQRPLLMDVPVGVFVERWMGLGLFGGNQPRPQARDLGEPTIWFPSDGTEVEISVPIRNVGPGIAFIQTARLGGDVDDLAWRAETDSAVPGGEIGVVSFDASYHQATDAGRKRSRLMIEVDYTGIGGDQTWRTTVDLHVRTPQDRWRVHRVQVIEVATDKREVDVVRFDAV